MVLSPWAQEWVDAFDSYTELSPSGTGLRIVARGARGFGSASRSIDDAEPTSDKKRPAIEAASAGKFFAITGDLWLDAPGTIEDRPEAWKKLKAFLDAEERAGSAEKKAARTRGEGKNSSAKVLARIVESADLFLNQDGDAFACVRAGGRRQTLAIGEAGFKSWLQMEHYKEISAWARPEVLRQAVDHAKGKAAESGDRRRTWTRVGQGDDGKVYLDLGDSSWAAVEIDAEGWRIVDEAPIHFRRSGREKPLPRPARSIGIAPDGQEVEIRDGSTHLLNALVRVSSKRDHMLVVGFLLDCLRPGRDHPILDLLGETGASKTSAAEAIVALVDPRTPTTASTPRSVDDLVVTASSRRVVSIDNVTSLSADISDALCRLTTGGGLEKRKLYTDGETFVVDVCAPVVMTGIDLPSDRDDLMSRTLPIRIQYIEKKQRMLREDLEMIFDEIAPTILGDLLDGVSCALRRSDEVKARMRKEGRLTRLADFAVWCEAAAPAMGWREWEFVDALDDLKQAATADLAEADPLVGLVRRWLEWKGPKDAERTFEGGAAEIWNALKRIADEGERWAIPKSAQHLSIALKRRRQLLAAVGVDYTWHDRSGKKPAVHVLSLEGAQLRLSVDKRGTKAQGEASQVRDEGTSEGSAETSPF